MSQVVWERAARNALTRYRKDDRDGVDQVLDSVNTLPRNPRPDGALDCGGGKYRIHVGRYRVWYTIKQRQPVVIAVDLVGRVR
ncbi:type II toxin-antitoxin system RelE family toxin [Streptomyces johnsoniae]|uniref:Type II toxin-antitoxin system RelE/ParE family toxin n=1 Tax=Streptomyces johnsoniae TaxID=3075532 RepID=A0ABU2RZL7_9ACTN|nr:type II toxin-antitoxin system RelE/ParE family toxin [Streptomyces sp. DSM 41886]MDT0441948.1 type II toxin-antitoxin system RelE/ParE family toxin [Streptomyces sp. DSM 41886]